MQIIQQLLQLLQQPIFIFLFLFIVLCSRNGIENFFINMPTRFTRNQSYDLRGDPYIIRPNPSLSPWGMSGYAPYAYPSRRWGYQRRLVSNYW